MNNFFKYILLFFYIILVGEIALRTISYITDISDIEKLKYAKKLIKNSNNANLSIEHIPNSRSKLMGVHIVLNSLGHRNKELIIQKPKNEFRIYIAGGSPVLGWGVEEKNTFASVL